MGRRKKFTEETCELSVIVRDLLREEIKDQVNKMFQSDEWKSQWDSHNNEHVMAQKVVELATEHAPLIFQKMMEELVRTAVENMSNAVSNLRNQSGY